MAANNAESFKQSRMPDRPTEARAAAGTADKTKTPAISYGACHVPSVAPSEMAAKPGPHADGLSKWASMKAENRIPVTAESFSKRKSDHSS